MIIFHKYKSALTGNNSFLDMEITDMDRSL